MYLLTHTRHGDSDMKAIGYLRVSTDEQAESGAGLAAQRDALERHCEGQGWQLQEVHEDDGVSGKA
ncbi:MAG: recombinase family protein, partial [Betaproteobacteria bacterium]|nr:recombinase family protein [Betaproteobacteria bacterium]